jgi:hypothetical protein
MEQIVQRHALLVLWAFQIFASHVMIQIVLHAVLRIHVLNVTQLHFCLDQIVLLIAEMDIMKIQ